MSDPHDEQERCVSCKSRKFDPPKQMCIDLDFHWLLAGRVWEWSGDDGVYKAVLTTEAVKASYDGLIQVEEPKESAALMERAEQLRNRGDVMHIQSFSIVADEHGNVKWVAT